MKQRFCLLLAALLLFGSLPGLAEEGNFFDSAGKFLGDTWDSVSDAADAAGVHGKDITPFLLAKVKDLTGGESLASNIQLALNNAKCAAQIAAAM